eukprot:1887852-Prymnesium_polylepis.1
MSAVEAAQATASASMVRRVGSAEARCCELRVAGQAQHATTRGKVARRGREREPCGKCFDFFELAERDLPEHAWPRGAFPL